MHFLSFLCYLQWTCTIWVIISTFFNFPKYNDTLLSKSAVKGTPQYLKQEMLVWHSHPSTGPRARPAWMRLEAAPYWQHPSGRSFNSSDSASVTRRVALRIRKTVCQFPDTVSGTHCAFNQRLILIAGVVVNTKETGLKTGNRFVLLRRSLDWLFRSLCVSCIVLWNIEDVHSFIALIKICHVTIWTCRVCACLGG